MYSIIVKAWFRHGETLGGVKDEYLLGDIGLQRYDAFEIH